MTATTEKLEYHPVANLFPLLEGEEFQRLAIDIETHGLLTPIWLHQGQIIDGRNRYRACLARGIEPRFQTWDGVGSLIQFVFSLNLHRRHLDTSQRAFLAAKAIPLMEAEEAEQRRLANLKKGTTVPESLERGHRENIGKTSEKAAKAAKVSRASVERAQQVLATGSPELQAAVEEGVVPVTKAAKLAGLSVDEQIRVIEEEYRGAKKKNVAGDVGDGMEKARKLVERGQAELVKARGKLVDEDRDGFRKTIRCIEKAQDQLADDLLAVFGK